MRRRTKKKIFRRGVYAMLVLTPVILGGLQMRRAAVARARQEALEPFRHIEIMFQGRDENSDILLKKDGEILFLELSGGEMFAGRIYGARFARVSRSEPLPEGLAFLEWLVEMRGEKPSSVLEERLTGTLSLRTTETIPPRREAGKALGHALKPRNHQVEFRLSRLAPGRETEILHGSAPGKERHLVLPPTRYQRDAGNISAPSRFGGEMPPSLQNHLERNFPSAP